MPDPTGLAARLTERVLVQQAQGVLMERDDYTARAALAALYVCAHKLDVDVAAVASVVVSRASTLPSSD